MEPAQRRAQPREGGPVRNCGGGLCDIIFLSMKAVAAHTLIVTRQGGIENSMEGNYEEKNRPIKRQKSLIDTSCWTCPEGQRGLSFLMQVSDQSLNLVGSEQEL